MGEFEAPDRFAHLAAEFKEIQILIEKEIGGNLGVILYTNKNLLAMWLKSRSKVKGLDDSISVIKTFYANHKELVNKFIKAAHNLDANEAHIQNLIDAALRTNIFNLEQGWERI